ncbi:MAG: TauD/TfdA family dioxygenase, partial [Gammaproteobacteria bacterium]|nr:TauD/TfdA family dioxygenase [Gammaproteobacteria bacterium]
MPNTLQTSPLSPTFGVEVADVDLSQPLDAATFNALDELLADRSLLLFRGQHISDADLVALGRR